MAQRARNPEAPELQARIKSAGYSLFAQFPKMEDMPNGFCEMLWIVFQSGAAAAATLIAACGDRPCVRDEVRIRGHELN